MAYTSSEETDEDEELEEGEACCVWKKTFTSDVIKIADAEDS